MNHAPASSNPKFNSARLALLLVLASETFFFGTLVSAYIVFRGAQTSYPSVQFSLARMAVPLGNTLLLLASALVVSQGLRAIRRGQTAALVRWFTLALLLGLAFVGGQALEYTRNGMLPSQASGGVFFTLMGFHAIHILAGVVVLGLVLARSRQGDFSALRYTAVEVGAWFWYYVVAVWLVLFVILYLV